MPTNDERREVAARLRELAEEYEAYPAWNVIEINELPASINDALAMCGMHGAVHATEICERLADLIEPEERTCRLTYDTVHDDMVCSSCGAWLDMVAYTELETSGQMRYCPVCGAKVVEE